MHLVALGMNQATASAAVRGRLAFAPAGLGDAVARLAGACREAFILSTCNRVELYAVVGHAESGVDTLERFLEASHAVHAAELRPHLYVHSGRAAVRHIMRVAAGLDSMVLGEDQIVHQLKQALDVARRAAGTGPVLERLVSSALAVGKEIRSRTGIGRSRVSVVSLALEAAERHAGPLLQQRVLLVGAGETAELLTRHLQKSGFASLAIANRTTAAAAALAARCGAKLAPWENLPSAIAASSLLITTTASPAPVIGRAELARRAADQPLLCLDLAVPRDVDPSAAAEAGVFLYDMDHLQQMADANRKLRENEIGPAEAIVEEGVERFMAWWHARTIVPGMTRMLEHAESIRDREVGRLLARMPQLSERERRLVTEMSSALVTKLFQLPAVRLQHEPDAANLALALERLFTPPAFAGSDTQRPAASAPDILTPKA